MDKESKKSPVNVNLRQWAIIAIIAISFISLSVYFKNRHHPAIAGMIAVMPIGLACFIVAKDNNLDTFAFSMGLGLAGYSVAAFAFYYFIHYKKFSRMKAIIYSMLLWLSLLCIFYYIFTDGPHTVNGK